MYEAMAFYVAGVWVVILLVAGAYIYSVNKGYERDKKAKSTEPPKQPPPAHP